MSYSEENYIMISALQHFMFCPRQCALIHVEQQWSENYLTTTGNLLHAKVNSGVSESRKNLHTSRSTRLCSAELGLSGISDVIEFYRRENKTETSCQLPGKGGWWQPYPVEYKRGKTKSEPCDEVQLCAQAICLEEMLQVKIESGSLYYGQENRRHEVVFSEELRDLTANTAIAAHEIIDNCQVPAPEYSKKCQACSLLEICLPKSYKKVSSDYYNEIFGG